MTTEQRLERLERENRWMRRIGVVAVAMALGALAAALLIEREPAQTPLLSQSGDELADLVVRSLTVKDNAGKTRIEFRAVNDGLAALNFLDKDEESRASLGMLDDGSAKLGLYDKDANPRVILGTLDDGTASLIVLGRDGKLAFALLTEPRGLTLNDAKGNEIWQAPPR